MSSHAFFVSFINRRNRELVGMKTYRIMGFFTKKLRLQFSGFELSAITKLALAMAHADGKIEETELACIALELMRFGIEDSSPILNGAEAMDAALAMAVVEKMDSTRKKYVAAYLGVVMASDGNIDDNELAMWKLTSTFCNLPAMTIKEAAKFITEL